MRNELEAVAQNNCNTPDTPDRPSSNGQAGQAAGAGKRKRVCKTLLVDEGTSQKKIHPTTMRGKTVWQVLAGREGKKRKFRTFNALDKADGFARAVVKGQGHDPMLFVQLTPGQIQACCLVAELLAPFCEKLGIGLETAMREYIEAKELTHSHSLDGILRDYLSQPWVTKGRTPILTAIESFLKAKSDRGCSPGTLTSLRYKLTALAKAVGEGTALGDITTDQLHRHVHRPTYAPDSRNTLYNDVHNLYGWLKRNGYIRPDGQSAMDAVEKPVVDHPAPQIMDVPTARKAIQVLAGEPDPEHVLLVVLALFTGAGPRELPRLSFHKTAEGECVRIAPELSMEARGRIVPLHPALEAWLEPFHDRLDRLFRHKRPFIALARAFHRHSLPWKLAWVRNSYGSHRLAATGDLLETSKESGLSIDVLARKFLKRVTKTEAEAYFALTPQACGITDWSERVRRLLAAQEEEYNSTTE